MSTAATAILANTRASRASSLGNVDPAVYDRPSPDSRFFDKTPQPFIYYPNPGGGAVDVLAFSVPPGQGCVLRWLAIVAIGGGYVDGSGNVIWRVLVNGSAIQGYEELACQVGTLAQPSDTHIVANEGDLVEITVEVPAGQPNMPVGATTAARAKGWFFPVSKGSQ